MFKKCFIMVVVTLSLVLAGGTAVLAQDSCVTELGANFAQPSTVAALYQYILDMHGVLEECDPLPGNVIEMVPITSDKWDEEDILTDKYGCLVVIGMAQRLSLPVVRGIARGRNRSSVLFEMKKPGERWFREGEFSSELSDDSFDFHIWDDEVFPKGRYELRYEPFIGADPVTLAFDVEHNTLYGLLVDCGD